MWACPYSTRKAFTKSVLWPLALSRLTPVTAPRLAADDVAQEAGTSSLVWRGAVMPSISPVLVFSAANRLKVPLRLHSKLWLAARPGDGEGIQSLR